MEIKRCFLSFHLFQVRNQRKPGTEKNDKQFYVGNYTYSLHIVVAVDSFFVKIKVFVRDCINRFVRYAMIFISILSIASAMIGKSNHQRISPLLKGLK